jgi:serine/threonine-protein kinase RsbW
VKWNSDPRALVEVRQALADFLVRQGVADSERNLIVLAVDEACANVMEHAYGGREGEVHLEFDVVDARFRAVVRDRGRRCETEFPDTFDMERHVAAGNRRGLGLLLIRKVMDDVRRFVDAEGINVLVLERKLHGPCHR